MSRTLLPVLLCLSALCATGARAADLVNIAGERYGTTVRADTAYSEPHQGFNAADGRIVERESCWFSADQTQLPCAITFTLAQPERVESVVLFQSSWSGNMYHTQDFAVELSDDAATWRRVATASLPDVSLARVDVPLEPALVRYLRIVVLTSYNSYQTCGLSEVQIMASGLPGLGTAQFDLAGKPAPAPSATYCGTSLLAGPLGPQLLTETIPPAFTAALRKGEAAGVTFDVYSAPAGSELLACAELSGGDCARVTATIAGRRQAWTLRPGEGSSLSLRLPLSGESTPVRLEAAAATGSCAVRWSDLELVCGSRHFPLVLPAADAAPAVAAGDAPALRPEMERALIEWDWRMQDGLGSPRLPETYAHAIEQCLDRGNDLVRDLRREHALPAARAASWRALSREWAALSASGETEGAAGRDLWRRMHWLRREIALANPLANTGPLLFVKQVPGSFSHQLTQYYGRYARPGGGVFILDQPGVSMAARSLTDGKFPAGSFQHADVSWDADRAVFSFCAAEAPPEDAYMGHQGRYYHLYEIRPDGTGLRPLTDGAFDDFAPRYMPDGSLIFSSTRRGGWHRCGYPGCETYVVTAANADGSNPRPLSLHETNEWDPAVTYDGRIIYTRWDYVDRAAIFFQQLWTMLPDGTRPSGYYGNMTHSPVGIWEARAIPGSERIMATAAAHHAMTAGSIILVDSAAGVDGADPIIRLTPDAPFPESETVVPPSWHAEVTAPYTTPEAQRWPGHCYRSAFPLSERYFIAAYSYETLVGEPRAPAANMFGLYLVDSAGNKELLYRDLSISSLWPMPVRPRQRPPQIPQVLAATPEPTGTFILRDVYSAAPALAPGSVKSLRVIQVLPKSTPGIDRPPVGRALGAPGKQVLGTVPVDPDGSAHFTAPANTPLCFQALDDQGRALQVMRSLTYLRAGESSGCVGCHEPRTTAPAVRSAAASRRPASAISPGPDGSSPLSYPLLVQPVLDRSCVRCHRGPQPDGGVDLTGEPEGHYTRSYNALAPRVPISDQGDWTALAQPGRYGALGSSLNDLLEKGHHRVSLSDEERARLYTWMDANALFYGTFDPADQERQLRGERIAGPALQ